jgi:hypothetical protein
MLYPATCGPCHTQTCSDPIPLYCGCPKCQYTSMKDFRGMGNRAYSIPSQVECALLIEEILLGFEYRPFYYHRRSRSDSEREACTLAAEHPPSGGEDCQACDPVSCHEETEQPSSSPTLVKPPPPPPQHNTAKSPARIRCTTPRATTISPQP